MKKKRLITQHKLNVHVQYLQTTPTYKTLKSYFFGDEVSYDVIFFKIRVSLSSITWLNIKLIIEIIQCSL